MYASGAAKKKKIYEKHTMKKINYENGKKTNKKGYAETWVGRFRGFSSQIDQIIHKPTRFIHKSTNHESDVMRIRPRTFWRRAYENDNTRTFCSDTATERANLKQRLALLLGRSIHERKFTWSKQSSGSRHPADTASFELSTWKEAHSSFLWDQRVVVWRLWCCGGVGIFWL